jgi:hypothetical protein
MTVKRLVLQNNLLNRLGKLKAKMRIIFPLGNDYNYTYDKNSSLGVLDTTLCDKVCQ